MRNKIKKLAVFIGILVIVIPFFPSSVSASSITENSIFNLTNSERQKNNQPALSWNYKLAQAARDKASDMINRDYFSHNTSDGKTPWTFITAEGYNYIYAGENLAMNFTDSGAVVSAWMNSSGHRANILSNNFKELGVGVISGEYQGYTTIMVVQMFGAQATSVYEENNESSSQPVKKTPAKPVVKPEVTVSSDSGINKEIEVNVTSSSTKILKKRIEDFQKTCNRLIVIINNKDKQKT